MASQPETIPVWPEGAPGSEDWTYEERELAGPAPFGTPVVRNVTRPTLTVFLPHPSVATGSAAVICPGGAFHFLSIASEGTDVARWLAERGVAAFVLKYRLWKTAVADEEFLREVEAVFSGRIDMLTVTERVVPLAIADGRQAMKVVRARAAEWGIAPDRIGMIGFSAGGRLTTGVALDHDINSRPSFAAVIYGALWEDIVVPADAPPLFIAVANDDELAAIPCVGLYSAWRATGHPVELHVYARGGHGFGMRKQGLPIDGWIDRCGEWLKAQGLLAPMP